MRSIYAYSVLTLGYCDMMYNFLVDKYGQIFEGRAGGVDKPVLGAHAIGFNTDSTGVAGVYVAGDWVGPRGWLADCALSSGEAAGIAAAREAARRADGVRPLSSRQDVA